MSALTLAFGGDVMLGRLVAEAIEERGPRSVWGDVLPVVQDADLFFVNLECALTHEDEPWHDGTHKAFYFRAEPSAVRTLVEARVSFASVANNHVLDFGERGLLETVATLDDARIAYAGAGRDERAASAVAHLAAREHHVAVVAFTDHPAEWAAASERPGINHVEITREPSTFDRVARAIDEASAIADVVVFSIHWGPNMRDVPTPAFREFAHAVLDAGATVFWGHSAHVVQGVELAPHGAILYDTGELVDDYAVDDVLRNDLSALFFVRFEDGELRGVDLVPVVIRDRVTSLARVADHAELVRLLTRRCAPFGTVPVERAGRLEVRRWNERGIEQRVAFFPRSGWTDNR